VIEGARVLWAGTLRLYFCTIHCDRWPCRAAHTLSHTPGTAGGPFLPTDSGALRRRCLLGNSHDPFQLVDGDGAHLPSVCEGVDFPGSAGVPLQAPLEPKEPAHVH
jgi:hypothetical protein